MKQLVILASCALAVLLVVQPAQAVLFFDSDFETCNVGTGNDFPCENWVDEAQGYPSGTGEFINLPSHNKIEIVNNLALSGSKSVKTTFCCPNGGLENPSLFNRTFAPQDHLFTRFGFRQSSGFQISTNSRTKQFRFRANGGTPTLSVWLHNNGGGNKYMIAIEAGYAMGTINIEDGPVASTTSFDQVETEWLMNTPGQSNGLVRLWVNGVLALERLNLALRGPLPTSSVPSTTQFAEAQIFVQSGGGNIWWDRVAVGNTRIGPANVGIDSTAPAMPTNFQVN